LSSLSYMEGRRRENNFRQKKCDVTHGFIKTLGDLLTYLKK